MRKQGAGSIINISSGATLATYPAPAAYDSARAGLNMLSAVARLELASAGITLSTFYPFMTATEFYQAVKAGQDQAIKQQQESATFMHSPAAGRRDDPPAHHQRRGAKRSGSGSLRRQLPRMTCFSVAP
ncbi:SDR family oxidoreductase (plasmid) [Pantoea piersonii]|uniref:SDR family oxidoreductase n=1 Tax=Pantoea piersonii TaxID=2364647 RepID=A0AAJ5QQD7_9GAMM|nr:SDR family NAD(P)-dependent oxidoreductase [Pantoea piersonii]WBG93045.1 SDR family oxidoreductase [Pantoea piersonii]